MKKLLLLLLSCILFLNKSNAQEVLSYMDNPVARSIVIGFKGYPVTSYRDFLSLQIEKANFVNGVYRNVVRLWYGKGNVDYVNLLYHVFPTEDLAKAALQKEYVNGDKILIMDWCSMETNDLSISLKGYVLCPLESYKFSKSLSSYSIPRIESVPLVREVQKKRVIEKTDGRRKRFTLPNYVSKNEDIQVFVNGKKLNKKKYTVIPGKKCIIFKQAPKKNKEVTISNMVKLNEVCFKLSFEGLRIDNDMKSMSGIDSLTDFNANYYSKTAQNVVLQGTNYKAWPAIVRAPEREGNALRFRAVKPNDRDSAGDKIRIAGNVVGLNAVEIVNSVDCYIPMNWEALMQNQAGFSWLTVQEYWCSSAGVPVDGEPQFRMTLGMLKNPGVGEGLYFDLRAEDIFTTVNLDGSLNEKKTLLYEFDDRKAKRFLIPFGEWFNIRTEIVSGDSNTGSFKLVVTNQNGDDTVIFDKSCQTFATGYLDMDTKQPLYKTESPLKLYTSDSTLQRMGGKPLEVYYDNWVYKAICVDDQAK